MHILPCCRYAAIQVCRHIFRTKIQFCTLGLDLFLYSFGGADQVDVGMGLIGKLLQPIENGLPIKFTTGLHTGCTKLLVPGDSDIKSIADLKGKKVAVGASGSGAEANARQILGAYGLTYDDIDVQYLSFGEAADALKDGNVDVGVVVAGFPTAAIQDLAANKSAALVNIDAEHADKLMKQYPYFTKITVPKGTYPGQEADVSTVAVKCVIVTTDKLSDDLGEQIVKAIYEHLDRMKAAHAVGKYITKDTALEGMSIKMNAGAEKYLKAK